MGMTVILRIKPFLLSGGPKHPTLHSDILEPFDSGNNQPNKNSTTEKPKSVYNHTKAYWMMKYGTTTFTPHHMNLILVEAWRALKVYSGNIIRYIFVKTELLPISLTIFATNTQACVFPSNSLMDSRLKISIQYNNATLDKSKYSKSVLTI